MPYVYALGAVKPWVKEAANKVGNMFAVSTIYGVGARETANSDHPKGLALDFMVGSDYSKGDQIAAYLQQYAVQFNVTYIIWKQRIWSVERASEGWRSMPDRGSPTANHYDHVHVSFRASRAGLNLPGGINVAVDGKVPLPDSVNEVKQSIETVGKVVSFVSDSHNWLRMGMFALGFLLILSALVQLGIGAGVKPASVRKVVKNVGSIRSSNA